MWPPTSTWEATMSTSAPGPAPAAIDVKLGAVFVSLELSRSTWLITSLSPGGGEKMSKHSVRGGDAAGLLDLLAGLRARTQARTGVVPRAREARRRPREEGDDRRLGPEAPRRAVAIHQRWRSHRRRGDEGRLSHRITVFPFGRTPIGSWRIQ